MLKTILAITLAVNIAFIGTASSSQETSERNLILEVGEFLRARIEQGGVLPKITVGEELIHASVTLPRFYEERGYRPAWVSENGPQEHTATLIGLITRAGEEGLEPNDYHLQRIEAVLGEVLNNQASKKPLSPRRLVDLDLLLTDAFLIYASHLLAGRVNPETIHSEWHATQRERNLAEILEAALIADQVEKALKSLLPSHAGYSGLREALSRYRGMARGDMWSLVPPGSSLKKGMRDGRVAALRRRLAASGDLDGESPSNEDLFDDELEEAVISFQTRHGLETDGVVGPQTLGALNVPLEDRVRQIELNLERWRWLPESLGERYILVNIADFHLDVVERERRIMRKRVVVGRPYRRTPVFSDRITYLVLSPYWHVPTTIAVEDMLPLIRKDPEYLIRQNIKVFRGWGAEAKEIDPGSIDWSRITPHIFPYRFRQDPGPGNALGQVKFMFPNKYNVYLHDTPARELFLKAARDFSSGCIRLERPLELAEYLVTDNPTWTRERIITAVERRIEQTVHLNGPVPVHLLYWTAWVDERGLVHFREDIYGRDALLDKALCEEAPTAA